MNYVQQLISKHKEMLDTNPYCYFELAYTRKTDWMAWICSNSSSNDPDRKIIARGQGDTPEDAAKSALFMLSNKY